VVHEINNPLTSISVYSEYLLKQARQDEAAPDKVKRLQRIHDSARRIFQFTQQLIAYAKPTGEEPTLVDVAEVLNKSLGFCEHVIRKANVTVDKQFGQDMPPVYGIEGQLEQIFVNLITNACHAMEPKKGGTLTLKVDKGQEGTLSIELTDDGNGIPPEIVKDIFEPFYTTKSEGEGTGLGLSIVKNIITNHEGDISVRSTPGEGTTFTVTLYASE
jgi:signal transduction histidine kinase